MKHFLTFLVFIFSVSFSFSQNPSIEYKLTVEEKETGEKYISALADSAKCLLFISGADFEVNDYVFYKNNLYLTLITCSRSGRRTLVFKNYEYLQSLDTWNNQYTDFTDLNLVKADCQSNFVLNVLNNGELIEVEIQNIKYEPNTISFNLKLNQKLINGKEFLNEQYSGLKKLKTLIKDNRVID